MSAPPPGPPSLADLPSDTLAPNIIASAVACWTIAAFFVAVRLYTRTRIIRAINSSDWCILVALLFSFGAAEGQIEQAIYGSGRHIWFIDLQDFNNGIHWARAAWYTLLFYTLTLCMSKVSILLLYLHIFTFQWVRWAGQIVLAIVIVSNLYMVIAVFTTSIPLQANWDIRITNKYSHPQAVWWANTSLLMITDFLIFLLPLPVVWTLNVPRRQKYALFGVFGLGFFVCLMSIIRLKYVVGVVNYPPPDYFYEMAPLDYWTMVEINGAIVCACLMTLKPFVVHVFPRIFSASGSSGSNKSGSDKRPPPTIGSKEPDSASKSLRHMREGSLDELRPDKSYDAALELEEAMVREDTSASSTRGGEDLTSMSTEKGGSLSPPPVAHLKAGAKAG